MDSIAIMFNQRYILYIFISGLILGTADLVPHSLFAICGLVDEDAETMMGSV